jgi:hypothetical protein
MAIEKFLSPRLIGIVSIAHFVNINRALVICTGYIFEIGRDCHIGHTVIAITDIVTADAIQQWSFFFDLQREFEAYDEF